MVATSVLCPNCALTQPSRPHRTVQRPIVARVRTRVGMGTNGVGQSPSELRSLTLYPAELRAQSAERRDSKGVPGAKRRLRSIDCARTVPVWRVPPVACESGGIQRSAPGSAEVDRHGRGALKNLASN